MKTMIVVGHANRERIKIVIAGRGRGETGPRPGRRAPVRALKVRRYPRGDFRPAPTGSPDTVH